MSHASRAVLRAQLLALADDRDAWKGRYFHLKLVIELACDALSCNDEAGAYLLLKNAVKEAHEVLDETSLQGLPVQEEPEVSPETGAND